MKKLMFFSMFSIFSMFLFSGLSTASSDKLLIVDSYKNNIVGIWAMIPLNNGIANVVEFTNDGKSILYPFDCTDIAKPEAEVSNYSIYSNGGNINILSSTGIKDGDMILDIVSIEKNTMKLAMSVMDTKLHFSYIKTNKILSLCALYERALAR